MSDLGLVLIGAGGFGARYAEKIARTPGARLCAVVDLDLERAQQAAATAAALQSGPAPVALTRVEDALAVGARGAVVAVPARAHAAVARPLLEGGLAVLMEKPFATSLQEADDLVARAEARGAVLQAAHLERFNPAVAVARAHIVRPRFVEAHRLGPFPGRGTDVDVVLDLMIHDLDLVLEFVNQPLARVSARGVAVLTGEVDIANARLEFEDGCVANLTASRVSLKRERKMRLFQENAYVAIDFAEPSVMRVRREPPAEPGAFADITAEVLPTERGDALLAQVASFVEAVRSGEPAVGAHAGRRALEVALLIGEDIRRWQ